MLGQKLHFPQRVFRERLLIQPALLRSVFDQFLKLLAVDQAFLQIILPFNLLHYLLPQRLVLMIPLRLLPIQIKLGLPLLLPLVKAAQILALGFRQLLPDLQIVLPGLINELLRLQLHVNRIDLLLNLIVLAFALHVLHLPFQILLDLLLSAEFLDLPLISLLPMPLRVAVDHFAPKPVLLLLHAIHKSQC